MKYKIIAESEACIFLKDTETGLFLWTKNTTELKYQIKNNRIPKRIDFMMDNEKYYSIWCDIEQAKKTFHEFITYKTAQFAFFAEKQLKELEKQNI